MNVLGMKLGFLIHHMANPEFERQARQAEALGFEYICCDDHLMSPFEVQGDGGFGCHEAWTAMSYLAGRTEKVRLNHMVLVPAFRGPGLLAKMAATLDQLSGGRLILTVGAGWFQKEYEAFQIPWETHKQRIAREREAVEVMRALWTQPQVTYHGDYYRLDKAYINPKPLQQPTPPIIISGDSRPSLELAAELGDGWMMHGRTPEEAQRMIAAIRPHLGNKAGRFDIGAAVVMVIDTDEKTARRKLRGLMPQATWDLFMQADIKKEIRGGIYGSPAHCVEQLKAYAQAGITSLTLVFLRPEDIERFSKEVLPNFE